MLDHQSKRVAKFNRKFGELSLLVKQQSAHMDGHSRQYLQDLVNNLADEGDDIMNHYQSMVNDRGLRIMALESRNQLFAREAREGFLIPGTTSTRKSINASVASSSSRPASNQSALSSASKSTNNSESQSSASSSSKSVIFAFNTNQFTKSSSASASGSASLKPMMTDSSSDSKSSDPLASERAKNAKLKKQIDEMRNSKSSSSQSNSGVQFKHYAGQNSSMPKAHGKANDAPNFSTTIHVPKPQASHKPRHRLHIKRHVENLKHDFMPKHKVQGPNLNSDFMDKSSDSSSVTSDAQKEASKYRPKSSTDGNQTSAAQSTQATAKVNSVSSQPNSNSSVAESSSASSSESSSIDSKALSKVGDQLFGGDDDSQSSKSSPSSSSSGDEISSKIPERPEAKRTSWSPKDHLRMKGSNKKIEIPHSTQAKEQKSDLEDITKGLKNATKNDKNWIRPDHQFEVQQKKMKDISGEDVPKVVMTLVHKISEGDYGYKQTGLTFDDSLLIHKYCKGFLDKDKKKVQITPQETKQLQKILDQLRKYVKEHPELNI